MSISDRLDQIEQRAKGATEGPWYAESRNFDEPYSLTTVYNVFHNGDTMDRDLVAEVAYDNAEFIAHARTDVPALVAALRAVLDVCNGLEEAYRANPEQTYEYGLEEAAHQVRNAVATALGEGS